MNILSDTTTTTTPAGRSVVNIHGTNIAVNPPALLTCRTLRASLSDTSYTTLRIELVRRSNKQQDTKGRANWGEPLNIAGVGTRRESRLCTHAHGATIYQLDGRAHDRLWRRSVTRQSIQSHGPRLARRSCRSTLSLVVLCGNEILRSRGGIGKDFLKIQGKLYSFALILFESKCGSKDSLTHLVQSNSGTSSF